MPDRKYVCLNGGLGNQMFQLAFGLFVSQSDILYLDGNFGVQRKNSKGQIDLLDFNLPQNVRILLNENINFGTRISNYLLRNGIESNKKLDYKRQSISKIFEIFLSIRYKKKIKLYVAKNVGFDSFESDDYNYFIGYFQSNNWITKGAVYEQMMKLELLETSSTYDDLKSRIKENENLIMHIRLGDYENESKIGILDSIYFDRAIKIIEGKKSFDYLWLFSDEPEKAIKFISQEYLHKTIVVNQKLTTPETFDLMRYGNSYIISNSSFSWWASFLKYDKNATIVAPKPWFLTDSPKGIYSPDWIKVDRC